jgi:hypothetical protein
MYSRIALRSISLRSDQPLPGNRLTLQDCPPRQASLPAGGVCEWAAGRDTGMQGNPGQDKGSRFLHSIGCESASIRSGLFVNFGSENAS